MIDPLFERMESDEYAEAQRNREIIENMQQRLEEMERINFDLEDRLEDQAKLCVDLEHECTEIERNWRDKCVYLEHEIDEWKKRSMVEEKKGDRLREQISRTEKELYSILQKKYELMRGPGGGVIPPSIPPTTSRGIGIQSNSGSYDGDISQVRYICNY
jgi:predicted RNase H-like nuclease (RuvC/YqgF family)